MRVGIGYDIHRLVTGRRLVLGGIEIPFEKGLQGHSDADVLLHATCDALLGAAGLGDIGMRFPDTDPAFKDISSMTLLIQTHQMVKAKGFTLSNIDATVLAEAPLLSPYRSGIQQAIASALQTDPGCVSVKATTTEGLGVIGRGEGIAAICVALIY